MDQGEVKRPYTFERASFIGLLLEFAESILGGPVTSAPLPLEVFSRRLYRQMGNRELGTRNWESRTKGIGHRTKALPYALCAVPSALRCAPYARPWNLGSWLSSHMLAM